MHLSLFRIAIVISTLSFVSYSQIDESEQSSGQIVPEEPAPALTISDSAQSGAPDTITAPVPSETPAVQQTAPVPAAPAPQTQKRSGVTTPTTRTRLPVREVRAESFNRTPATLAQTRQLAKAGLTQYVMSMVLNYGVATPLALGAVANNNEGLAFLSMGIGLVSGGLKIAGPIRAGVGASLAYDLSKENGWNAQRNINWGFYKTGWGLTCVSTVLSLIANISVMDGNAPSPGLSVMQLGMGIASDAMFLTAAINSAKYTKDVEELSERRRSSISVYPTVTYIGNTPGVGMSVRF